MTSFYHNQMQNQTASEQHSGKDTTSSIQLLAPHRTAQIQAIFTQNCLLQALTIVKLFKRT